MIGCPSADEIADVIDTVKLGIDRSTFGPLFQYKDDNPINKDINQLCFALLMAIIPATIGVIEFEGVKKGG